MSEILGRWNLMVGSGDEGYPSWLELTEEAGRFVGRWGSARPVPTIEIEGDRLRFALPRQYENRTDELVFWGKLVDGHLEGTTTFDNGTDATWIGIRAPELPKRDVTFGKPIELIGGTLDGWHVRWPAMSNNWSLADGQLVNSEAGTDLITDARFTDFRLVAEYKYPKGSNSGIYLRGRYEFQILDDFEGAPNKVVNSGSIYGFLAPSRNTINPPDEWNHAEITLIGRHVAIVLNGELIVDGEIPGITGGAMDGDEGEPGPVLVQGDHGPVTFRKLTLYPAQ